MGTRLYDPGLGRFTTRDVLFGEVQSPLTLNQFAYTSGTPITFMDPTGMAQTAGSSSVVVGTNTSRRKAREAGVADTFGMLDYSPEAPIVIPPPPSLRLPLPPVQTIQDRGTFIIRSTTSGTVTADTGSGRDAGWAGDGSRTISYGGAEFDIDGLGFSAACAVGAGLL